MAIFLRGESAEASWYDLNVADLDAYLAEIPEGTENGRHGVWYEIGTFSLLVEW